jgi:uncharacterized protein (DUF58 family)
VERGRISVIHWWTVLLLPAMLVIAIFIPYDVLFHLAYLWGWLLLVSWIWVRYQGPRVELRRELRSDWAQVGDELEEFWVLENAGFLPLLWMEVSDASTLPGYNARRVAAAASGAVEHWTTSAICSRRGRYRLGPLAIELSDPLGLFRYRRVEAGSREMLIYPPLVRLPTLERPRGQRGGAASADFLNVLPTPSAASVRDYRPGDPLSFVHWRAVARTGKLMVKEFDQEVAGAVWIILDLARAVHSGTDDDSTEELAVVLACSLANIMLGEGRTVGLFAHGAEPCLVHPGRGRQHLWQFMSVLVDAHADGDKSLTNVIDDLRAAVPGRHAAVVITPDASGDWIASLTALTGGGKAAQVLLVDMAAAQAAVTASRLGNLGIPNATFRVHEKLPLLTPARKRGPTYRVTPLGKVIKVEG